VSASGFDQGDWEQPISVMTHGMNELENDRRTFGGSDRTSGLGPEDTLGTAEDVTVDEMLTCTEDTGGKGWFPGLVHHKSITRTWTKYLAKTHLVHCKFIQNVPSQFPCSFPGSGNGQYICSFPGHVTRVFPSGTPWEHLKVSQRKYPENT